MAKRTFLIIMGVAGLVLIPALYSRPGGFSGKVTAVSSNIITVRIASKSLYGNRRYVNRRIKLYGTRPAGKTVRLDNETRELLLGKTVVVQLRRGILKNSPRVLTGRIRMGRQDVGALLIKRGLLRTGFGASSLYRRLEARARRAGLGLWKKLKPPAPKVDPVDDPKKEDPKDDPPKKVVSFAPPPRTCSPEFVSSRRKKGFYKRTGYETMRGCVAAPSDSPINETASIPIYFAIAGTSWTQAQAQAKMNEAVNWFARYCITLRTFSLNLSAHRSGQAADALAAANAETDRDRQADKFAEAVHGINVELWTTAMGRSQHYLLVLFVEDFDGVDYGELVANVSGNFEKQPVILVPFRDRDGLNIVTHELIHGLGKTAGTRSLKVPPTTKSHSSGAANENNTWLHASCALDMGSTSRTRPDAPFRNSNDLLLDWASYVQFRNSGTIK